MAGPRKSGTERGGRKKAAGTAQGHRKKPELELVPADDSPVAGEVVDFAAAAAAKLEASGELVLPDGVPALPIDNYSDETAGVWINFWKSEVAGIIKSSDLFALKRWIGHVQELEDCHALIGDDITVEGSTKQVRMHPAYKRIGELEDLIARAEVQFGMTPKSRVQIGLNIGQGALTSERINQLARERKANGSTRKKPSRRKAAGDEEAEFERV